MTEQGHAEGAWVFLSHSHKDLEKVRRIRDALEAKGHNPLMFFLKCLDDDSEVDDLIRREIEARTWFILCDSPDARASRWVQEEVEIIKGLEGKVYEVIDLDDELDTQVERVTALSKRATVFISYSRADEEVAEAIRAALCGQDFRVFDARGIQPGARWDVQIPAIDQAVQQGFFLLLLSPEALESEGVWREVREGLERQATSLGSSNLIPVVVRDREATLSALIHRDDVGRRIAQIQVFDLSTGDVRERIAELIRSLMTREME